MKKATILLAFLLALTGALHETLAQPQGTPPRGAAPGGAAPQGVLTGAVVDVATGEPIETATIALWNAADSTLVTGALSQADGGFAIEGLRPGRYYARVSFVGYETREVSGIALAPSSPKADLGKIQLSTDTAYLDEVEVSAERSFVEVGIDRTVYNVKDQPISAGGSASDVLRNIPSVEVDVEGKVSLRGNQNVAILINGRPSPMTGDALTSFLQGLPSDAIERVEVIPNPSAKYEPDGMAGILNIVLKQGRDLGASGSLTLSATTNENYNASANVSYSKGKVGLSASYSLRKGSFDAEGWRFRENRFLDPLTVLDQENADARDFLGHTVNTSLDYKLSKENTLTLSALLNRRGSDAGGFIAYTESDAAGLPFSRFDRLTEGDGRGLSMDYRLAFRHVLDPSKNELTAELRFENEAGENTNLFTTETFLLPDEEDGTVTERQANELDEGKRAGTLQVDYIRPLGEGKRLEAGYKGEVRRLESDFFSETFDLATGTFVPDAHLNNTFVYDQQIHAAYGIVGATLGKFNLQGGVRLEQALTTFDLETTNESFDNNYFSVFPSAYATYSLTETRSVKLSYSKRINRPRTGGWFNQLNPFNTNEDPFFRRVGNPYLQPEYVHAFEGGLTQLASWGSLTFAPYFRRTVDAIRFIETTSGDGVTTLTFQNLDTSDSWGAELNGTLALGRRLNAFLSLNAYKVVTDGSNVDSDLSNSALGFSSRANATLNVRPGLDLQMSYFYSIPMDVENGRIAGRRMADLGLRQKLFGDRASLSLNVNDVFGTMGFHVLREDETFFMEMDRSFNAQQVGLSFTYNFGQQAPRPARRGRDDQRPDERPDDIIVQ